MRCWWNQNDGLMVHPDEKYGYVDDEPVRLNDLAEIQFIKN